MKRVGKSSPLPQYVTFSAVFHNAQETKTCFLACDRKPDLTQLDRRAHMSCPQPCKLVSMVPLCRLVEMVQCYSVQRICLSYFWESACEMCLLENVFVMDYMWITREKHIVIAV